MPSSAASSLRPEGVQAGLFWLPSVQSAGANDSFKERKTEELPQREKEKVVNTKAIYAAGGGIAAVAIIIFFVMGNTGGLLSSPSGSGNPPSSHDMPPSQGSATPGVADLGLSIKSIAASRAEGSEETSANVQIAFSVHNPNRSTALLETIHYTVFVDGLRMTSGDIGVSAEGFVGSQADNFPIVSNSTITLRDTKTAVRNDVTASSWDSMVDGTAKYVVEGTYVFRATSGLQGSFQEKDFTMTFP